MSFAQSLVYMHKSELVTKHLVFTYLSRVRCVREKSGLGARSLQKKTQQPEEAVSGQKERKNGWALLLCRGYLRFISFFSGVFWTCYRFAGTGGEE